MDWKAWTALGALVLLAVGVGWLIWRAAQWRRRTRAAAAKTSRAEVRGWEADALDEERARSDEEALQRWRENFSGGGDS